MNVEPIVTTVSNLVLRRQAAKAPSSTPMTNDSTWTIAHQDHGPPERLPDDLGHRNGK